MSQTFNCNHEGYLLDFLAWQPNFAEQVAGELGHHLDAFDWQVIKFVRGFFETHHMMPLTRAIVQYIKQALDPEFDSIKLQQRYTTKPLWLLAKLAGAPKPAQCI